MNFTLVEVERFPDVLTPGQLYWSREFAMSAHLCACGCGDIIYLPIGPADYSLAAGNRGPTLDPSIGNWNVCNAHYFIRNGKVEWASKWTPEQIAYGRAQEDARREAYFSTPNQSFVKRLLHKLRRLIGLFNR